jgi:hypothetical protein
MEDLFTRVWDDLIARISGPLHFRFLLQPLMASIFAIRAGLDDARENRPPYFWSFFTQPDQREKLAREGWEGVGKVFIIAIVIDGVYQLFVLRWFYPGEALILATVLAILPYLLIRGPLNRLVRLMQPPKAAAFVRRKKS